MKGGNEGSIAMRGKWMRRGSRCYLRPGGKFSPPSRTRAVHVMLRERDVLPGAAFTAPRWIHDDDDDEDDDGGDDDADVLMMLMTVMMLMMM